MKRENWPVTEYAVRSAGKPDECFYCNAKLGEQHQEGCVIRTRTIVVKLTVELVRNVPEDWDTNQIEFQMNEGSWCLSNLLPELEAQDDRAGCLCAFGEGRVVREATAGDEQRWRFFIADAPFRAGFPEPVKEEK